MPDFELTAAQYGSHLFSAMLSDRKNEPKHWASIRAKAEPLVQQLLALNDEMEGGGYVITGVPRKGKDGKKKTVLPAQQRIEQAQERLWGCKAGECKKGDRVWLIHDYDNPCEDITPDSCCVVDAFRKTGIVVEDDVWGEEVLKKVGKDEIVLRAPKELMDAWKKQEKAGYKIHMGTADEVEANGAAYRKVQLEVDALEKKLFSDEYWLEKADELDI